MTEPQPAPMVWLPRNEIDLRFRFITPMFGGGPVHNLKDEHLKEPDSITPVRFSALRQQMRFWWRAAHAHEYSDIGDLRRSELAIFGSTDRCGSVTGRVRSQPTGRPIHVFESDRGAAGHWRPAVRKGLDGLGYGVFPLRHPTPQSSATANGTLTVLEGEIQATLWLRDTSFKDSIVQALRCWVTLGGLGGRSRRGFGSVDSAGGDIAPLSHPDLEALLAEQRGPRAETPQLAGGNHRLLSGNRNPDATAALNTGLKKLYTFRQGAGVGRVADRGHSTWPEPNAVRRARSGPRLTPHGASSLDKFPRAAFGLPILFQWNQDDQDVNEPLTPVGAHRWPSRLIIRPVHDSGSWCCLALALSQDIPTLSIPCLLPGSPTADLTATEADGLEAFKQSVAVGAAPNPDTLLAFLDYFSK